jgi:hypothetical protein
LSPGDYGVMTDPASYTLAYLRQIDGKLDRVDDRLARVEGQLGRIEDELLVLNGIILRLEGRDVETTGLKSILDRDEHALALLGRRMDELEGADKG